MIEHNFDNASLSCSCGAGPGEAHRPITVSPKPEGYCCYKCDGDLPAYNEDITVRSASCNVIRAAVSIPYKGYEISLSTIPSNPELVIFMGNHIDHRFITRNPNIDGIVAAMQHIDALTQPQSQGA
jgi:hypothetical protein